MEEIKMQCPECKSTHIRKNGINKQGKQNHICVTCSRQFIDSYEKQKGYDEETKRECLTAYVNGMGFRGIERLALLIGDMNLYFVIFLKPISKLTFR
jgi:transposase-like protein